jgi:hypothetical protein
MNIEIQKVEFWESMWEEARQSSFLMKTQAENPKEWFDFFNAVGDIYLKVWGNAWYFGNTAARILVSEGLIQKGYRVLDAGCGPGTLAIPMAEQGAVVTALDYSPAMLNVLEQEALNRHVSTVVTVCQPFESYSPDTPCDLVTAAFVPPAIRPSGITRMESWTKNYCAVMVGSGGKEQKLRKALWQSVMDKPPPSSNLHLIHLMGYLLSSGRMPNVKHISCVYPFTCPVNDVLRFYTTYFSMFQADKPDIHEKIQTVLKQFTVNNRVEYEEEMNIALVWWRKLESGI